MTEIKESKVYDISKFIAVILVVVAHSTRMYTGYGAFDTLNDSNFLSMLTEYIYKFHMPLFILISGAVFGICIENGKYKNILQFISNKAKRLLIPYYSFGFVYVAPVMCLLELTNQSFVKYCIEGIIVSRNSRHLWYLLALFLMFILAILVKPLLNKSRKTRFVLLICSLLVYLVSSKLPSAFQISATASYQFFFFVGVCLHYEYAFLEKIFTKLFFLFIPYPFILMGMFWFDPNRLTNLCYIFVGIIMILFIAFCVERWFSKFTNTRIYKTIHKNSFGIYLFHPMIIYILYYFLGSQDINPYILCFGIVFVALFVSIVATEMMRVFRLNILIGESRIIKKQNTSCSSPKNI